jgi:molecular chaperone GrpE
MTEERQVKASNDKEPELETLRQELAAKEEELKGLRERLLRLQADFDNYRKQVARETGALARRVQDQEILDFLPVYDALERAFQAFRRNEDSESFVEGVERIFAQFAEILKRKGCQPFDSVGRKFDPAYHEVLVTAHDQAERNVILEEFERGWLREGEVLRPAKVKVSLGPKGGEDDGGDGKGNRN